MSNQASAANHQVVRDIELRNVLLRRLARVLLVDGQFLHVWEAFNEAQIALLEVAEGLSGVNCSPENAIRRNVFDLELKVAALKHSKVCCERNIATLSDLPRHLLKCTIEKRLKEAIKHLANSHRTFRRRTERTIRSLPDIWQIAELEQRLLRSDFLHDVVCKNHLNELHSLQEDTIALSTALHCTRLRSEANALFILILVQFKELVDIMDSEESVRTLQNRLQSEIERTLNETQDDEQEIGALREKLFPSVVSLTTQRNLTIEKRDQQAVDLEQQLQMIDQLETEQQNIEERVQRLIEARGDIQRQLADWQGILHDGVRDIVRLERLIAVLERELAARKEQFDQNALEMQQKRIEILGDDALDTSERSERLQAWDVELMERKNSHTSNMDLLEARCDKLKQLSKNLVGNADTFEQELATDFQTTMAQLEREKTLAKTASEQSIAEAKLHNLQQEYEDNLQLVSRARTRLSYLTDENGRYHLDGNGARIYEQLSGASSYCLSGDGHWPKVGASVSITDQGSSISCPTSVGELMSGESSAESFRVLTPATQATEPRVGHDNNAHSSDTSIDSEAVLESESEIIRQRVAPDVAYVQQVVGPAVVKGMAAVALHRPTDPVNYLADYLKHFHGNQIDAETRKKLMENVRSEG
ncbi:uncharacterized protein LOC126577594 [Anopheles aquasalis]|uniref:uncharacterized protein LOC126577594 n=1 Tax=Anopheles aquasalis TaxID=42839 RepID=UPI00215B28CA|nr:uncharacterized protein LOC126577594 [Anopheles aquasalis]